MRIGEYNSYDHYIYYYGQESLIRKGMALILNKRIQNAVLGCNLKNKRMISVRFQSNHSISHFSSVQFSHNITVIQVYTAPLILNKQKLTSSMKT